MPVSDVSSYRGLFIETANEHVNIIDSLLLQKVESDERDEIFRRLHSLKGSSSVMGYKNIASLCDKAQDEKEVSQLKIVIADIREKISEIA